jgi:dienelactone hydrolase
MNTKAGFLVLLVSLAIPSMVVPTTRLRGAPSELQTGKMDAPSSARSTGIALRGTAHLELPANILTEQRDEISSYFLKQIASTPAKRDKLWLPDFSSPVAYRSSVHNHRLNLRKMLGMVEPTVGKAEIQSLADEDGVRIEELVIPLGKQLRARALLFLPEGAGPHAAVIAIPPEDQTREEFVGIAQGMTPARWLTGLLERQVAVAVPMMVERRADHPICEKAHGQDRRRILWRLGFIVGQTLVGIDVEQVIAVRNFLASQPEIDGGRIAVLGKGQGGMTALYATAVDDRIAGTVIVDYFQQREGSWKGPVDQVLYGQLNEFGDAEVAALIAPRPLAIVSTPGGPIPHESQWAEVKRAERFYSGLRATNQLSAIEEPTDSLEAAASKIAEMLKARAGGNRSNLEIRIPLERIEQTRNEYFETFYHYLRSLCEASDDIRTAYWQLRSTPPTSRPHKVAQIRKDLTNLMGMIPRGNLPLHPRTVLIGETDKFLAYDVLLDVVSGVEAYGQLLVPREVGGDVDRRLPAVVCQHGFGGAPRYVTGVGPEVESQSYFHKFGERLAERGYVVFAPYVTVPYGYQPPSNVHRADLINPLVRQAASLGVMRTSIELTKLHCIVDFLQSLPFVDTKRIGYYGISYGGYSALWMSPLEPRLRFTIISGHFNSWRLMLTDEDHKSYWNLPDEDFYNWNVLNRFGHAELIAAMWPRPVCIEYGSEDTVTIPEWHKLAWEDITQEFVGPWGMRDRVVDDDFIGRHMIHGIGTFFFIDRWLRPERPAGRDYGCGGDDYCTKILAPGFHGYVNNPESSEPYVSQSLDSDQNSLIEGRFYVPSASSRLTGIALKVSRVGRPGDLLVRLGSKEGENDLGEARVRAGDVYSEYDLWYEAKLTKPARLDPSRLYFFEVMAASGKVPENCYTIYGVRPLGGKDYPSRFSLAFRTLTEGVQPVAHF